MKEQDIGIGSLVKYSPVGAGKITDISDTGYPRVNDVGVNWLICVDETTGTHAVWKNHAFDTMIINVEKDTSKVNGDGIYVESAKDALLIFKALNITHPQLNIIVNNDRCSGKYQLLYAEYSSEGPGFIVPDSNGAPTINGATPMWYIHKGVYHEIIDWGKSLGYYINIRKDITAKEQQSKRTIYVNNAQQASEVEEAIGQFARVIYDDINGVEYRHFPYQRLRPSP